MTTKRRKKMANTPADVVFNVINYSILALVLLAIIYPLWFILIASFSDPNLVTLGKVLVLPRGITLEGYKKVFDYQQVWVGFRNSVIYTFLYTVIGTYLCLVGGYFLSRRDVIGNKLITGFFLFTMFFSGGLIPTYLVVDGLKMTNTMWAVIIPGAVSVYNMIIARSFIQSTIPGELREASELDGCSNFRFFFSVVFPLSTTLIAVLSLFHAVAQWNAYFDAMIYLSTPSKNPLQIVLRDILIMNTVDSSMMVDAASMDERQRIADMLKYVLIIVASVPMLVLYPFIQNYFVKGVMIGSVKG